MVTRISRERWQQAQEAERVCHKFTRQEGERYYKNSYDKYFEYLGMNYDQQGKTIVEIGCADFPALQHCTNVAKGVLIEPMPSPILEEIVSERPELSIIQCAVEDMEELPECDEIWLLNVMQHVIDPDLFVEKCKQTAKVIRFFEPIDWPVEIYHPHTFDFAWYDERFGAKFYDGRDKGFHTANCAYGTWVRS